MKRKLFLIFALILFVINPVFASSKKDDINDYINIALTIIPFLQCFLWNLY